MKLAFLLPLTGAHLGSLPTCAQAHSDFPTDSPPPFGMPPKQDPGPDLQGPLYVGWPVGGDANIPAGTDPQTRVGPTFLSQSGAKRI